METDALDGDTLPGAGALDLCVVDGCENQPAPHKRGYCWGHWKRKMRRQTVDSPLAKQPSGLERLREAAIAYADATGDREFDKADENLRKSAVAAASAAISDLTRRAMAKLKREGVHLGRPRKVDPTLAAKVIAEATSVREAAIRLQVSERTVWRWLSEKKGPFCHPIRTASPGGESL